LQCIHGFIKGHSIKSENGCRLERLEAMWPSLFLLHAGVQCLEVGPHKLEEEVRRHRLDQTELHLLHHIIMARLGESSWTKYLKRHQTLNVGFSKKLTCKRYLAAGVYLF
jgi:hypothetical protein